LKTKAEELSASPKCAVTEDEYMAKGEWGTISYQGHIYDCYCPDGSLVNPVASCDYVGLAGK
jgi:hypothetical protein